ncbi:MAG: glycosyl transferase family 1, partial [Microvirga sp.]|nr:glycosyl transferase family 1 [Microvirga sp.]
MTDARPVAFYAPLKSPNHLLPSGDRTMARLLMKALDRAGYAP